MLGKHLRQVSVPFYLFFFFLLFGFKGNSSHLSPKKKKKKVEETAKKKKGQEKLRKHSRALDAKLPMKKKKKQQLMKATWRAKNRIVYPQRNEAKIKFPANDKNFRFRQQQQQQQPLKNGNFCWCWAQEEPRRVEKRDQIALV